MNLKQTILNVLQQYEGSQFNIDSQTGREMVADQLVDEIKREHIVTSISEARDSTGWTDSNPEFD